MITWLIQDTARMYSAVENEITPLNKLGFQFRTFGVIPFTNTITGLDDLDPNGKYIVRGGTKIVDLLSTGVSDNLSPELMKALAKGVSYNKMNFDQAYYSELDLPLLNAKPEILDLKDDKNLHASFSTDKFVKPSSDLKAFTGGVMEAGEVLKYFIERHYHRSGYAEETALVHDVEEINSEYRFICLNGKVLQGSQYRGKHDLKLDANIPSEMMNAAVQYATLYKPSDLYTMDLADTPNGIKIVEYNCWNGSGLYAMNVEELFTKVQEYYESKS